LLTSDHGTSPSYDLSPRTLDQRFNVPQFEMILESFLDARYGRAEQNWVLEYENQMVYLNHNLIYEKRLSLSDVQNEVATFAMQFRGVSHALSATAMRTSYFGSGYARQMQNGFYPRRSGDVILNLMPGWIEKRDIVRSTSGSMYSYDRHVPLVIYRGGEAAQEVEHPVEITSVAPTLARILGIPSPAASEGSPLKEPLQPNL
jgi:arylsulfatase A-like enzyme